MVAYEMWSAIGCWVIGRGWVPHGAQEVLYVCHWEMGGWKQLYTLDLGIALMRRKNAG